MSNFLFIAGLYLILFYLPTFFSLHILISCMCVFLFVHTSPLLTNYYFLPTCVRTSYPLALYLLLCSLLTPYLVPTYSPSVLPTHSRMHSLPALDEVHHLGDRQIAIGQIRVGSWSTKRSHNLRVKA